MNRPIDPGVETDTYTTAPNPTAQDADPRPRSDWGTIILHWTTTVAMLVSLFTGLRLSADAEGSVFAKSIRAILPQGEIWTWHFLAAIILIGAIFAYPAYMSFAGLRRRAAISKVAILTLPASRRMKWSAVNVALHWVLFVAVLVLGATGVALYMGYGGWIVTVHYISALVALAYILCHLVAHFMYGGIWQWLRLFRPTMLTEQKIRWPLTAALAIGVVLAGSLAAWDYLDQDKLYVVRTTTPPTLDGELNDPVWSQARPVFVNTMQGVHLNGTGASRVEIRAARDAERVYFAFRWEDPTRSIKRLPLIKREDGWHLLNNKADIADETEFYEDKLAILFSRSDAYGNGGTTHLGEKPLADKPAPLHERGYHYTTDGSLADVWQWKASRGGHLGFVDDMWFAAPVSPTPAMVAGQARYQAGYDGDKGRAFYSYNYGAEPPGGFKGVVKVPRLPKDWKAVVGRMGPISLDMDKGDPEGQVWWMTEAETEPYTPERDKEIPVGTILPAVIISGEYQGSRAEISGAARWKDGFWTLEASRALVTGKDDDLAMASGLYIWVSVFDHNQTRHTRHMRPVRLEMN